MGVEMKRLDTVRKSDGQECSIYRRNAANERARNINLIPFVRSFVCFFWDS